MKVTEDGGSGESGGGGERWGEAGAEDVMLMTSCGWSIATKEY